MRDEQWSSSRTQRTILCKPITWHFFQKASWFILVHQTKPWNSLKWKSSPIFTNALTTKAKNGEKSLKKRNLSNTESISRNGRKILHLRRGERCPGSNLGLRTSSVNCW